MSVVASFYPLAVFSPEWVALRFDEAFGPRTDGVLRWRPHPRVEIAIEESDLILFVVDASWSMAVSERMAATKGAIMSLLTDAYQRRDCVGLVVFQKDRALLVLPAVLHAPADLLLERCGTVRGRGHAAFPSRRPGELRQASRAWRRGHSSRSLICGSP